jgi:hypothetical protein
MYIETQMQNLLYPSKYKKERKKEMEPVILEPNIYVHEASQHRVKQALNAVKDPSYS